MPFSRSVPPKKKRVTLVVSGALLFVIAAVAVLALNASRVQPSVRDISFSQLRELSESGTAQKVSVSGEVIAVTQADGAVVRGVVTNAVAQHEVVAAFEKARVPVEFETMQPGLLVTVLNYVLPPAARHTPFRPPGHGQDSARARRRVRGRSAFPLGLRLKLPGEVRGPRRRA